MLMPKRVKHRKQFRGSMTGKATRGNTITYGIVIWNHVGSANQIEAARIAMTRYISGKVWIKIFPEVGNGSRMEVRMGKGKGLCSIG